MLNFIISADSTHVTIDNKKVLSFARTNFTGMIANKRVEVSEILNTFRSGFVDAKLNFSYRKQLLKHFTNTVPAVVVHVVSTELSVRNSIQYCDIKIFFEQILTSCVI